MADLELVVRGARGSMSVSGRPYLKYGGNTSCFQVALADRQVIFDCGTGLRSVQHTIEPTHNDFVVFLTHYHWDHLQGIPVFAPFYLADNAFTFYGPAPDQSTVAEVINAVIRPPWFPVAFADSMATVDCRNVPQQIDLGEISITTVSLTHPDPVVGYRIDGPNRSIVLATDHEAGTHEIDAGLVELAQGADVLIHDAQYTPQDYLDKRIGWGHSTWEHATKTALAAGVDQLVLTSHDPDHDDDTIDAIEADARSVFANTVAVQEGMRLPL
ncbi:MAG: MBL fold metallo-hydrolase [Acidimicrobiia bacterium]